MGQDSTGRCGACSFFFRLRTDEEGLGEGECRLGCWPAPLKETASCASHKSVGAPWKGALKRKSAAGTPRRYRDDDTAAAPTRRPLPQEIGIDMDQDEFREALRQVLREELGVGDAVLGERWRGGEVVLKPGRNGTQDKVIPLDAFFSKIVGIRDKLRVLEQKINTHKGLSTPEKLQLQQYITGCYGSLTTFNVLFQEREDGFTGQRSKD